MEAGLLVLKCFIIAKVGVSDTCIKLLTIVAHQTKPLYGPYIEIGMA